MAFVARVERSLGVRLSDYKEDQMRRRLMMLAKTASATSFLDYLAIAGRDPATMQALRDQMTINVTELLRNPRLFEDLDRHILPELVRAREGMPLAVWSAGCSYGAEAYSVAMLLREMPGRPPFKIKGTDLDLAILARANSPRFSRADMVSVPAGAKRRHFIEVDEDTFLPTPDLRSRIGFSSHDLLADPYPVATYDLILCRNVVIYFNEEAQNRVYQGFARALRPGGVLFVGGSERVSAGAEDHFERVRPFFYRVKAAGRPRLAA